MALEVGAQLAGYRLDALIGHGGGGVVYRATHLRLERPVAIKVLAAEQSADDSFRRRFEREARLTAALDHPNIVPVHDAGEVDGRLYLAMRFVDGLDLAALIAQNGPLGLERTCALLGQVAGALDAANAAGLVHRDVKPANILVERGARAFLSDFGLTSRLDTTAHSVQVVAGTLAYMAPERFDPGHTPEPSIDVYGLGCTAYTCLRGSPPFGGATFAEIFSAHLTEPPPSVSRFDPAIPVGVDAVLARAVAKRPADRFRTCGEFVAALRAAGRNASPTVLPTAPAPPPGRHDQHLGQPRIVQPHSQPHDLHPPYLRQPAGPPVRRRRGLFAGVAAVAALAVAAVVTIVVVRGAPPAPGATSTPLTSAISAMALDGSGNLYFASFGENRVQKLTPSGDVELVAGTGAEGFSGDGGPATQAQLRRPDGLAVTAEGSLLIADTYNLRVREVDRTGTIRTIAGIGNQATSGDGGPAVRAEFDYPVDVATGPDGSIFVLEANGDRVRRIDATGTITTVAGSGNSEFAGDGGPATMAGWEYASSIAVAGDGTLYIGDTSDDRIRKVAPDGTISTLAGTGTSGSTGDGGPANAARIALNSVAVGPDGAVLLTESGRMREIDPAGVIRTIAGDGKLGTGGDGGPAVRAKLAVAGAIVVAPDGSVYVADNRNRRIRRVDPAGTITTVVGNGPDYPGDGAKADQASLTGPTFVCLDSRGRIYISDSGDGRIRRVDPADGTITTVAGNGNFGFSGDGGLATQASLNRPLGIAVDAAGVLYIADSENHRVRAVSPNGVITTVAGDGQFVYSKDGLPSRRTSLAEPSGIVVEPGGTLLVTEREAHRIRRIDVNGVVSTIAGKGRAGFQGAFSGDGGPAVDAELNDPFSLARAPDGTLYVNDSINRRIRKIGTDGVIETVAGDGETAYGGDGGPATAAQLNVPSGILVDSAGNLLVSDEKGHRVRQVDTTGTITPVAGSGATQFLPPVPQPALAATLEAPIGLAETRDGDLIIADQTGGSVFRLDRAEKVISLVAGAPW
ncbi:protein kinase [Actinomycetes bacterium KLBMP 9759]